jgi:catechol-2,3-dioxygenase
LCQECVPEVIYRNTFYIQVKAKSHSRAFHSSGSNVTPLTEHPSWHWRAMEPIIDHIQITVKDMDVAVPFYEKLLPLLGFTASQKASAVIEKHDFHVVEWHSIHWRA